MNTADVLPDAFIVFAGCLQEYAANPPMSFYSWLRFLASPPLQMVYRYHLCAKMRDADREVSLTQGSTPEASGVRLAAQLLGQFTSVVHAVRRTEKQHILQNTINELDPLDREILALRHFVELSKPLRSLRLTHRLPVTVTCEH